MGSLDSRREGGHKVVPVGDELVAQLDDLSGETIKGGFINRLAFEKRVAGAHGTGVTLEQGKVAGDGLGEEEIQKTAATTASPFHKGQIFRAKGNGSKGAKVIGEALDWLLVECESAFAGGPVDTDIMRACADGAAAYEPSGLAMTHHGCAAYATKGAQGGEQMQCFQNIGFPLGIAAEQEVESRFEVGIQPGVVPEIPQS